MKHEANIMKPSARAFPSAIGVGELTPLTAAHSGARPLPHLQEKRSLLSGPVPWIAGAVAAVLVVGGLAFAFAGGSETPQKPSATAAAEPERTAPQPSTVPSSKPTAKLAASVGPTEVRPGDAEAKALRDAVNSGPANGSSTLLHLLKAKPETFRETSVQAAAAAAAEKAAENDLQETDEIFEHFATKLGEPGLDVLYELASLPEGSKAATRAHALLAKPEVIGTGSTAMRIAYDLRKASCSQRTFLFTRAAKEGDDRTLVLLSSMLPPACEPRASPCCFLKHGELEKAVAEIRARIRR
jgi:serine/threonine-protein kinase